ncbi:MAG: hypothetical protein ACPGOV_04255 [Magnetovibrionaceae bacterium]
MTDFDAPPNAIREAIRFIRLKSKYFSVDDSEFQTLGLSEDIGLDSPNIISSDFLRLNSPWAKPYPRKRLIQNSSRKSIIWNRSLGG